VVAIPLTFESTALWISWACLLASGSAEYFRVEHDGRKDQALPRSARSHLGFLSLLSPGFTPDGWEMDSEGWLGSE
jgi:hypothetical protein